MAALFPFDATTEAGSRYQGLMRGLAREFADRAADYDRSGRFVEDNVRVMQARGTMGAAVPEELGGLGVSSFHDLVAGIYDLAQGCGSTSIVTMMHFAVTFGRASAWRALTASGDASPAMDGLLRGCAEGRDLIAVAATEPGTYAPEYPLTTATPADGGWLVRGRKIFATLSPVATMFQASVCVKQDGEPDRRGSVLIPRSLAGVTVVEDWDAMGMRGSGSGQVIFENCAVPPTALSPGPLWGQDGPGDHKMPHLGLAAAGLGIARAAHQIALNGASDRRKAPHYRRSVERVAIQLLIGENEIALGAATTMLRESLLQSERSLSTQLQTGADSAQRLSAANRATKTFVERVAVQVVERAMEISGGGGYLSSNPLSRLYRDVRAIPFMAPQATESVQYVGMVAAGLQPELDL